MPVQVAYNNTVRIKTTRIHIACKPSEYTVSIFKTILKCCVRERNIERLSLYMRVEWGDDVQLLVTKNQSEGEGRKM